MDENNTKRKCLHCNELLIGRVDKKYCNTYCKSAFQYNITQKNTDSIFRKVDKILKNNRKVLKIYNKAGKAVVRKETLEKEGFNPNYFTNYWKSQSGDIYLFCYEYGFLQKKDNYKDKYILIKWQKYMES